MLETEPAIRLNNLVDQLADQETGHEKIIRVIRFMVDTGELSLQDDRISLAYS